MLTNDTHAEIAQQARDRLAEKANSYIDQLDEMVRGVSAAPRVIGALRAAVELLRDTNSDDVRFDLQGLANQFTFHAVDLAMSDEYEGAKHAIECAEAFTRRRQQIEDDDFREPVVDCGVLR